MDKFYWNYETPAAFTDMRMYSDGRFLTGLAFEKSADGFKNRWDKKKRNAEAPAPDMKCELLPVFEDTIRWLDEYFGKDPVTGEFTCKSHNPDFVPAMRIDGLTPFRRKVMTTMISIPYGQTVTYGELARIIGKEKMSARAVGGAVGWNPICLIIPCHRVLGSHGSITGYGGGTDNKVALLRLEGTLL